VQLLSIDSARQNVDIHFNYIAKAHAEFARQFTQQVPFLTIHFHATGGRSLGMPVQQ
jgi:hypothetical protein